MKEIAPGIISDRTILNGKPVIKGTRVPVEVLVGHLAAGDTVDRVARAYEVTADDVRAALHYAAKLVADERILLTP
jgi:uncharacterized protein (DUF433 family)